MLTYEALVEQAKIRGMPVNKIRGILREYLQVLILKELYSTTAGKTLYFTGGTYLRLAHSLKRFSEDLDFNTEKITKREFESLLEKISAELTRTNVSSRVRFTHWRNIYSGQLIFPDIEKDYGASSEYSKKEGIVIKIETNRPKWRIKKETPVISGFGEIFPVICTESGALFADKIDALDKKGRARHLYDIIFMLANKYPINEKVLSIFGIKGDPLDFIVNTVNRFSEAELKKQADSLRPFLFEEAEAEFIVNARQIIPSLVERYR